MVQNWELPRSARHFTSYRIWVCRIILDILYGTEVGAVEMSSAFFIVQKWALSSPARHSNGTALGAVEFSSTCYMVHWWALSSFARHRT